MQEGDIRLLTEAQRKEMRDYEELFATTGWKRIQEDCEHKARLLRQSAINATTIEALAEVRGRAQVLDYFATLESAIDSYFAEVVSVARQAREEEREDAVANS
jgi:hypothetical protein